MAKMMSVERGFLIFRRFTELNTRSLLYLQAELVHLEQDLVHFTNEDHNTIGADPQPQRRHELSAMDLMESNGEQWKTILTIREKLETYSRCAQTRTPSYLLTLVLDSAILQQAEINKLLGPSPYDLKTLQKWLARAKKSFSKDMRHDHGKTNKSRILLPWAPEKNWDATSRWLAVKMMPRLHRMFLHKFKVSQYLPKAMPLSRF